MNQSGRIPDTHAEAWVLLPFVANGRISPQDREWVELHVQSCEDCRRELEQQLPLAQAMREAEPPYASSEQRAFAKLWTRIEASEGAMRVEDESTPSRGAAPRRTVRWLAAAVLVQAVGLALLGATALRNSEANPDFVTVTAPETQQARAAVRLVFTSETSMGEVTRILENYGLELVGGPRGAGVFTATLTERSEESPVSIAEALRAHL